MELQVQVERAGNDDGGIRKNVSHGRTGHICVAPVERIASL